MTLVSGIAKVNGNWLSDFSDLAYGSFTGGLGICNYYGEVGEENRSRKAQPHQPTFNKDCKNNTHHADSHGKGVFEHA